MKSGYISEANAMAGGVFGYRVGDLMPAYLRTRCGIVSPSMIGRFLDEDPPIGILSVGGKYFESFDQDLISYAKSRGYREIGLAIPGHRFFV